MARHIVLAAALISGFAGLGYADSHCGTFQREISVSSCQSCSPGQIQNPGNPAACMFCPPGKFWIKEDEVSARCEDVSGFDTEHCGTAQRIINGGCSTCGNGQVRNPTSTGACMFCPPGEYKALVDETDPTNAVCELITGQGPDVCGSAQRIVNGGCSTCSNGQIRNPDNTGACMFCAPGEYKYPSGTPANATCVEVHDMDTTYCGRAQRIVNGGCSTCGNGQIRNPDNTGACKFCEPGELKVPAGSDVPTAFCVSISISCGSSERAVNGMCSSCGDGQIRSESSGGACMFCPPGKFKLPPGSGLKDSNCVEVTGPGPDYCGTAQRIVNGVCSTCGTGQIRNIDNTGACAFCVPGKIKVLDDETDDRYASCVQVSNLDTTYCGTAQRVVNGVCSTCSNGQIRNSGNSGACAFCPPGTIKVPAGSAAEHATCEDVGTEDDHCPLDQRAINGVCSQCGPGQIRNPSNGGQCIASPGP